MRIVLCDTNPTELEGFAKICRSLCAEREIKAAVTTFSSGESLLFEMSDRAFSAMVSVLVVDPENGCEKVAATVRNHEYDGIILYLSHSRSMRHIHDAFDARAINFADKGDLNRFAKVFGDTLKAAEMLEHQCISVSCAGEYKTLDTRDVYYFEPTMDHMVCVKYTGGDFIFQSSLSELEARLHDRGFIRVHRSYLIALDAVHTLSFDEAVLNNGKRIPIARGSYAALKDTLDKWRR